MILARQLGEAPGSRPDQQTEPKPLSAWRVHSSRQMKLTIAFPSALNQGEMRFQVLGLALVLGASVAW